LIHTHCVVSFADTQLSADGVYTQATSSDPCRTEG